jgi:putative flavoprotein involved in K+ transport
MAIISSEIRDERYDVVVIGAGQAGLSVGHHLARQGLSFVILESHGRVGDSWRARWDSLRLFTPAHYDGLDGMRFPAPGHSFPTKDEMADFLEQYATAFALPVRTGVKVEEVTRDGDHYVVRAAATRYRSDHLVVASASYQKPKIPGFAAELDPCIRQLHSSTYKRPSQLEAGSVLLVGAGNSGAELAMDLARTHRVWLSGNHPGHLPFAYDGAFAYGVALPIVFRLVFHRLLSVDTPIGRKARPHFVGHGGPLIRVKPAAFDRAGVNRVPRLAGVSEGKPVLEDGRRLEVDNIVWCTGYHPGLDWIKLPVFDEAGRPRQYRGVAAGEPGLYFAGLAFLHSASSSMIHGVGRDARRVANEIARRIAASRRGASPAFAK